MKNKQTAVEWLLQRFEDGDMYNVEDAQFIKHQALAMEKEQILEFTRNAVRKILDEDRQNPFNLEQYYNETYEK